MAENTIASAYERRLTSKTPQRIVLGIAVLSILLFYLTRWVATKTAFWADWWYELLAFSGLLGLSVPLWLLAWAIMARRRSTRELKFAAANGEVRA